MAKQMVYDWYIMIDNIIIRDLTETDRSRVIEIALAAWAPIYASFRQILGEELYIKQHPDWRTEKAGHIESAFNGGIFLVAEQANTILGFVSFFPETRVPGIAEIGNNAVHPDFQGQGIAQLLYEEAFSRLRSRGIKSVMVRTGGDPSHLPARKAYEKAGFDICLPHVDYFRSL